MASIETYKIRLSSKEEISKAQKGALLIEHDAAVALLEQSKALNVGRALSNANNKAGKLQACEIYLVHPFPERTCQAHCPCCPFWPCHTLS
jgi:hypothetical protein